MIGWFPFSGTSRGLSPVVLRSILKSLLLEHHGKGKLLRHVVLSLEDCLDPLLRRSWFSRLEKMAFDFMRRFAPNSRFIGIGHGDRVHTHAHLLISNSDGRRTLDWSPSMVKEMQSMSWTAHAVPGRGAGRGKAVAVYPLAKNLDAKTISTLTPEQIHELINTRQLQIGRAQ